MAGMRDGGGAGLAMLLGGLPETVAVGGARVAIRTDYRVGILFERLTRDAGLDARVKVWQALRLYYRAPVAAGDAEAAYRAAVGFWRAWDDDGGAEDGTGAGMGAAGRRVFDWAVDGPLVYAAFLDQYGVDLAGGEGLHWWRFKAMFAGLRGEHEVVRRMAVRGMDLAEVAAGAERARVARLKRLWRIERDEDFEGMTERAGAIFG